MLHLVPTSLGDHSDEFHIVRKYFLGALQEQARVRRRTGYKWDIEVVTLLRGDTHTAVGKKGALLFAEKSGTYYVISSN